MNLRFYTQAELTKLIADISAELKVRVNAADEADLNASAMGAAINKLDEAAYAMEV